MDTYVVLGAGVIGLSTALELRARYPSSRVLVVAKHLPGDRHKTYTSPWAGAHWMSYATDNGVEEERDTVTFQRFTQIARDLGPVAGISPVVQRVFYNQPPEESGVFSTGTEKIWYDRVVPGGIQYLSNDDLPEGACFGFDFSTFLIDTQRYLPWLQHTALQNGISIRRGSVESLHQLFELVPGAKAYFNCAGLGARSLGDVRDQRVFPTRGQVILVESPQVPIERLYVRATIGVKDEPSYVFPRRQDGGVILGGCFQKNNWDGEVDLELAERIKARCCALCPELGRPEDLKVLQHGVGLRPTREGGARIEREAVDGNIVIHCYGFGGTGYQASWGSAKDATDLLTTGARL